MTGRNIPLERPTQLRLDQGQNQDDDRRDPEVAERHAPDPEPSEFRQDAKAADLRINAGDTPTRLHDVSANAIPLQSLKGRASRSGQGGMPARSQAECDRRLRGPHREG
jgi:alpha-beta hydrolase superfamily lysophospholipase